MNYKIYNILAAVGLLIIGCSGDDQPTYEPPTPPAPPQGEVVGQAQMWVTNGEQTRLLSKQDNLNIYDNTTSDNPFITVNTSERFQEIEGFGAALTGSSAYLINRLNTSQKNVLLSDLFNVDNGIGISYIRMSIGASDFSLSDYTYNDMPQGQEDPELSQFTIAEDERHIVPVFKSILQVAPNLKIMGSPWTAPAWMKTNQSLHGGSLRPTWYDTYANYFVEYIRAYERHGISIDAITPQNEPLHVAGYPTMNMEATAQAEFIKNSLGPTFEEEGINTKIIAYDHNFDRIDYPLALLQDQEANRYIDGIAFHAYAGDVSAMSTIHQAFPDKGLYFTEISGGEWATNFGDNLKWNMRNILIGTTKNWSKTAIFWNLALDENHGPTNNGCQDCRGVVTIDNGGNITKNVEYYAIGHLSKFVRPGAFRISSTEFASGTGLRNVAFENLDGTKALIILNESSSSRTFSVVNDGRSFSAQLEANAVATIIWN